MVSISNDHITTKCYTKKTDTKQYIRKESCHPKHQFLGIPYSQALRIKRICSSNEEYEKECLTLITNLLKRGYTEASVAKQISKVDALDRHTLLFQGPRVTEKDEHINFILTYRDGYPDLTGIIRRILIKHDNAEKLPFRVAFRRVKNLRDLFVSAALHTKPPEKPEILTEKLVGRGSLAKKTGYRQS